MTRAAAAAPARMILSVARATNRAAATTRRLARPTLHRRVSTWAHDAATLLVEELQETVDEMREQPRPRASARFEGRGARGAARRCR